MSIKRFQSSTMLNCECEKGSEMIVVKRTQNGDECKQCVPPVPPKKVILKKPNVPNCQKWIYEI